MVSHIKVWPLGKMKGGERKKRKEICYIFIKLNPNQHSQGRKIWLSGLVV
jgi:hypothetical protein